MCKQVIATIILYDDKLFFLIILYFIYNLYITGYAILMANRYLGVRLVKH